MTNIESEEFNNLPFSLDGIQFSRAPSGIFYSLPVFAVSRHISSNRNFLLPLVLIYDGCWIWLGLTEKKQSSERDKI